MARQFRVVIDLAFDRLADPDQSQITRGAIGGGNVGQCICLGQADAADTEIFLGKGHRPVCGSRSLGKAVEIGAEGHRPISDEPGGRHILAAEGMEGPDQAVTIRLDGLGQQLPYQRPALTRGKTNTGRDDLGGCDTEEIARRLRQQRFPSGCDFPVTG